MASISPLSEREEEDNGPSSFAAYRKDGLSDQARVIGHWAVLPGAVAPTPGRASRRCGRDMTPRLNSNESYFGSTGSIPAPLITKPCSLGTVQCIPVPSDRQLNGPNGLFCP